MCCCNHTYADWQTGQGGTASRNGYLVISTAAVVASSPGDSLWPFCSSKLERVPIMGSGAGSQGVVSARYGCAAARALETLLCFKGVPVSLTVECRDISHHHF